MKPKMILATIAGGMTGIFLLVLFDVGLRAPAAPGSIFAVYAQTPNGDFFGITVGVFGAALVSFLVGSVLLKMDRTEDGDLGDATAQMEDMKGKKSVASSVLAGSAARGDEAPITSIVFACDAGMGSSAMGASVLRRKIQDAGFGDVTVVNKSISSLTDDYDIVVSHQDLTDRAKQKTGSAVHVSVDNFMGSPRYDEIVELVQAANGSGSTVKVAEPESAGSDDLLAQQSVVLRGFASTRNEAITEAGELLVDVGAVEPSYIASMHEREESVSTHMGNGLAIPHGTNDAKSAIRRTAISFVRYPNGIDWNGHQVKFVVGIAGAGDDHLALLSNLSKVFVDREKVDQLEAAKTVEEVRRILG
jgi:PTS system mannitol-specific IIC component